MTFPVGSVPAEVTFSIHHSERLGPRQPNTAPQLLHLQPVLRLMVIFDTGAVAALGPATGR